MAKKNTSSFVNVNGVMMYPINEGDMTHKDFSNNTEIHAEVNAISKMAKSGVSSKGCILYCNYSPCINCAKSIIASGIDKVFYRNDFDDSDTVVKFFNDNGVSITKL